MIAQWLYPLYERRLMRELEGASLPRHIAIMLDGNRRWAAELGKSATFGHKEGAKKISDFLLWCDDAGIELVTLWLLSTDNMKRSEAEVKPLLEIIASTVEKISSYKRWRINMVGNLDMLPESIAHRLRNVEKNSADLPGMQVNIAVMYGGRQEITDAVRAYLDDMVQQGETLEQVAKNFQISDIANHLYTKGQPDPDLVIRTSGEQRMSGFMLWQSVHTELYFCETYWPDFRRVDFLRALRDYTHRDRRRGS